MRVTKAEREALRRELTAKGYAPQRIAVVMGARYGVRPRLALRWAFGMTLGDVAAAWNQLDCSGRAPMTERRVSDYERWPDGGKRPTAYVLLMLAKIWDVGVERLVDPRDYAALNDKQLFETVELCHHNTQDVEQTAAGAPASGSAQERIAPVLIQAGAPPEAKEAPTKRREVIQLGGVAVAAYVLELLDVEPDRMHAALDAGTVSEQRLAYFELVADRLGVQSCRGTPAILLPEAAAHFRSVRRLVADRQRTLHQVRLSRAGAKLAIVVGDLLFNEGLFDLAREWYQVAQDAALDAGDRYLADIALCHHAYLPTYTDDPSGVLALVGPRLEQRCRPTPAVAWLWSFKGKAHAALGERAAFDRAMSQAHKTLGGSPADLIAPGIFSFLPEKLEFYAATGYVKLRDTDLAVQTADRALALYDPTDIVDPTLIRLDKASALTQAGEVPQACDVATRAVLDPHVYHTVGLLVRAREFDALLGDDRAEAVRDWREVLATIRRQQDHRRCSPSITAP